MKKKKILILIAIILVIMIIALIVTVLILKGNNKPNNSSVSDNEIYTNIWIRTKMQLYDQDNFIGEGETTTDEYFYIKEKEILLCSFEENSNCFSFEYVYEDDVFTIYEDISFLKKGRYKLYFEEDNLVLREMDTDYQRAHYFEAVKG